MESNIFKEFASILSEVSYLLENNEFEILKLESEKILETTILNGIYVLIVWLGHPIKQL